MATVSTQLKARLVGAALFVTAKLLEGHVGLWIVVTLFFAGLHLLSKGTSGWTVPKVAAVFHRYRCRTCRFYHRFLD